MKPEISVLIVVSNTYLDPVIRALRIATDNHFEWHHIQPDALPSRDALDKKYDLAVIECQVPDFAAFVNSRNIPHLLLLDPQRSEFHPDHYSLLFTGKVDQPDPTKCTPAFEVVETPIKETDMATIVERLLAILPKPCEATVQT